MSNQIKLTIDLSDELVDKLLTVMALSSQKNPLQAAMPMLMGMGSPTLPPKSKPEQKPSMGFKMDQAKEDK